MTATPATPSSAPSTTFDPSVPVPEEYDVFCHACGYSLLGLAADRCPECGNAFNPGEMPYARVPWLHRKRIGCWSAYWKTVRQVVRRPGPFAEELCRPVRISADDARRFRKFTIYLAATSGLACVLVVLWIFDQLLLLWRQGTGEDWAQFLATLGGGWAAAVFFLHGATDMPLFIWKGLPSLPPSELAPLHHYASAPLALVPAVLLVAVVVPAWVASTQLPTEWTYTAQLGALVAGAAWVLVAWHTPMALMRGATRCGKRRMAVLGLYLPVHCAIMAVLTILLSATVGMIISEGWTFLFD
jgi:hypothetical protein